MCFAQGQGRYEVHSLFLPSRASGETVKTMRRGMDYIFAATECTEVVTKTPRTNKAAIGLARIAGFSPLFSCVLPWNPPEMVEVDCLGLSMDQWALKSKQARELGIWLHDMFEEARRQGLLKGPAHSDEDATHHQMAGAAVMMVRAGNARKGVDFYNRWATFAGYLLIRLLSEHPVIIDLEGMIVESRGQYMEILSCR